MKKIDFEIHDEVDGEGTWAISYGDMVTLLLSFFIIFFSINPSQGESDKTQKMKVALFNFLTENLKEDVAQVTSLGEADQAGKTPELRAPSSIDQITGNITKPNENLDITKSKISVSDKPKNEIGIDRELLNKWNGIAHDQGDHIIIEFKNISFFNSGDIKLTPAGEQALYKFAQVFAPYMAHFKISIRAFTDSKQVRRNANRAFKDNLELSALRGIASMRTLQRSGVPLTRMSVGGYGELITAIEEISKIPPEKRSPAENKQDFADSLSRKIVLYIEPEVSHEKTK